MEGGGSETIVVGIDGSPGGQRALQWAIAEAKRSGRALRVVRAFSDTEQTEVVVSDVDAAVRGARGEGVAACGQPVQTAPVSALLDHSKDAAMLVVGSRGLSPLALEMLGSVSEACVREAHVPVVVIPGPAPE